MIYHISTPAVWKSALITGEVVADSLATEGFIHCSRERQLLAVADRFFPGTSELVVLGINEAAVASILVNEGPSAASDPFALDVFPHLYGPIPVEAVVTVAPLTIDDEGIFQWPEALPRL